MVVSGLAVLVALPARVCLLLSIFLSSRALVGPFADDLLDLGFLDEAIDDQDQRLLFFVRQGIGLLPERMQRMVADARFTRLRCAPDQGRRLEKRKRLPTNAVVVFSLLQ